MFRKLLSFVMDLFCVLAKLFFMILPSLLVLAVLMSPEVRVANESVPVIGKANKQRVHGLLPNTKWSQVRACGAYFDEVQEFNKSLQCANKVLPKKIPTNILPIRCFVVTTESPDLYNYKGINFIPSFGLFGQIYVVMAFYDDRTETMFISENIDDAQIYRHELQHHFLKKAGLDPDSAHIHDVWKKCEPQYYSPSDKAKVYSVITDED